MISFNNFKYNFFELYKSLINLVLLVKLAGFLINMDLLKNYI